MHTKALSRLTLACTDEKDSIGFFSLALTWDNLDAPFARFHEVMSFSTGEADWWTIVTVTHCNKVGMSNNTCQSVCYGIAESIGVERATFCVDDGSWW